MSRSARKLLLENGSGSSDTDGDDLAAGVALTVDAITAAEEKLQLPNEPGGFAYVPAGSPGFDVQSVIVAEWRFDSTLDRVAVYEVDDQGDPVVTTRREFFVQSPRPWGA